MLAQCIGLINENSNHVFWHHNQQLFLIKITMVEQQSIHMSWFKQCSFLKLNNLCSQSPNNCNSTYSQQSLSKTSTYSIIIQSSMIASTQSIFLEQMASIEHRERQGLSVSPPNLFIIEIIVKNNNSLSNIFDWPYVPGSFPTT